MDGRQSIGNVASICGTYRCRAGDRCLVLSWLMPIDADLYMLTTSCESRDDDERWMHVEVILPGHFSSESGSRVAAVW